MEDTRTRIQKYLSEAGVASRRAIEDMIVQGLITVNGRLVVELPCFVDPEKDDIRVDGQTVRKKSVRHVYYLLNKPRGVLCTSRDPRGRPKAIDFVPPEGRVYTVGRLEEDSSGLVILTNDGQFTQALTHPKYGLENTDVVEITGRPDEQTMRSLKHGIFIEGRRSGRMRVRVLDREAGMTTLELKYSESMNRLVHRVMARLGHKVRRLKRIAIGPVNDRGIKPGSFRFLDQREVRQLLRAASEPLPAFVEEPADLSHLREEVAPPAKPTRGRKQFVPAKTTRGRREFPPAKSKGLSGKKPVHARGSEGGRPHQRKDAGPPETTPRGMGKPRQRKRFGKKR